MIKYKIKRKIVDCEKLESDPSPLWSVTLHDLSPSPLSQSVTLSQTPPPLERDILYGRPLTLTQTQIVRNNETIARSNGQVNYQLNLQRDQDLVDLFYLKEPGSS